MNNAYVACRRLGYSKAISALKGGKSVKAMVQFGSRNLVARGLKARYCSAQMPRGIWGLPAVPMRKQNAAGCSVIPLRQASDSPAKRCNSLL